MEKMADAEEAAEGTSSDLSPRDRGSEDQMRQEFLLRDIEVRKINLQRLEEEVKYRNLSLSKLISTSSKLDKRKADLLAEIAESEETAKNEGLQGVVERLKSMLSVLKDLEKHESEFRLSCKEQCANMEKALMDIEKGLGDCDKDKFDESILDHSIADAQEKLNLAKGELGAKRRAIFSLQGQLSDFPIQSELIQYEHQFSGLYLQIQEKLQKTRQHYDTYNALVERKELMLKELSLLNSISSQFQEAILENSSRLKLMDSMEAILKGTQQKLKKVESVLHEEQGIRDFFEEKYSTAVAEHRHFSSLVKSIQEERALNERIRAQMPL